MNRLFVLAFVLLLSSCASVPMSTVATLSQLDEHDLATLDSSALRVKVSLPNGFILDAANSRLTMKLVSSGKLRRDVFDLTVESQEPRTIALGFLAGTEHTTAYVLKLSPASR